MGIRYFFSIIVVFLLAVACNRISNIKNDNTLVKIGNKVLHRSILEDNVPKGLSKEDSIIAAENFIHSWVRDVILYDIAVKNLYDKENIERLVEEYRKSLLIYQYEEQLVNEKMTNEIDEQSLSDYYNQNKDILKLDRPLVKGLFLRVPVTAPQLDEIHAWYKSAASVSQEKLEKYALNNNLVFNYFMDKWIDFNDAIDNFPKDQIDRGNLAIRKGTLERQNENFYYFLNIVDYLQPGDNAPYEYAKPTIREIIINQRKIEFLKKTEEDLYQRAVDKGEVQFYYE